MKEVIDTVSVALASGEVEELGGAVMQEVNRSLLSAGVNEEWADKIDNLIVLLFIIGIALLANVICRRIILRVVAKLVKQTKATWDDIVFDHKVMVHLSRMVAPILIYIAIPIAFPEHADSGLLDFLRRLCMIYILAVFLRFVSSLFTAIYQVYSRKEQYRDKPLKGLLQTAQVILFFIGAIIIISILINQSPVVLLTGLGSFCCRPDVGIQRQYYGICVRYSAFCQQYAESGRLDYHAKVRCGWYGDRSNLEHRESAQLR